MAIVSPPPSERAAPPRMAALATLPVFLGLKDRKAIVSGGSAAAAWKAELLAATGAVVQVYAEDASLSQEMRALLESGSQHGALIYHARPWATDIFAGASMAVADADTEGEAKAFACAATAAGVPVNIIDKPAFCRFQFGAIVNRSPVVVGISTDGAAPILGQAIRRRIETLLPPALADWAALAQRLRARISDRLTVGAPRRAFWEGFVDRAFSGEGTPDEHVEDKAIAQATKADAAHGRVTLVGAGPGDAELLTLKAVRALQSADIILFDDLVSDEVLELARREARRMLVGKRGGRESCRQEDINDMMVKLARSGKHVVRLKSGDPMIFGRAGEEITRLSAEGIAVDIVPGISAGVAMAARLGISLTHRDCAQSVRFVTGHSRNGRLPADLDWRAIADPTCTTIFYMGGRTAGDIVARLMDEGMSGSTPAVICASISRPNERRWTGTLSALTEGIAEIGYDEPVLLGIGRTFAAALAAPQRLAATA